MRLDCRFRFEKPDSRSAGTNVIVTRRPEIRLAATKGAGTRNKNRRLRGQLAILGKLLHTAGNWRIQSIAVAVAAGLNTGTE